MYPGYTKVKEAVWELRCKDGDVFVPLVHGSVESKVDFGYTLVVASRCKRGPGKLCNRDHSWKTSAILLLRYVEGLHRA